MCDYHSREISHFVGNKSERHCVHHYVDVYLSTPDKLPVASSVKPDSFPAADSGTLVFRFRSLFRPLAVRFSAKTQAAEKRPSSKKFFDTIHT